MKTCNENRWAFKVLAGSYISEDDLKALGISADWHLYLSHTEPPSAAQCNQQMNAYDLIACPCCGGRATIIGTLKTCEWSVICTMCGLETAHMMQPRDAASAWNKRYAPDEEGAALATKPAKGGYTHVPGVGDYPTDYVAQHFPEFVADGHEFVGSPKLGGEICSQCGAVKGTRRGRESCRYAPGKPAKGGEE